jgi:adhesin/invasin
MSAMNMGEMTIYICSDNAGPAVISATAGPAGPSSQISIEFVATIPTSLILQATLTSLAVNQQSVITAVLRDAQNNLVKNQTVSFSLTDVSGGQIFPASAVTDSFGRASTIYTAGAVPSANNGVGITAAAVDTLGNTIRDTIRLTVARQALFVVLGTANNVVTLSTTQYALAYSVLVTDANGSPIANTSVTLSIPPTQYRKGPCGNPNPPTCPSEDSNRNGILDPGEDTNNNGNNNGILDPGNVATVPTTVTTNTTGFAFFDVVYAQEFAGLVEVELNARTVVVGSEGSSQARFFLPGACIVPPVAPFGVGTTCTDPE